MNCVIITNVNDGVKANEMAQELVREKLAACVNIIPGVTSVYRWDNNIVNDSEWLLLIKTRTTMSGEIETYFHHHHPYDVPEIAVLPVGHLNEAYEQWIKNSLKD